MYETGLFWQNDKVLLPDNEVMTLRRLICFEKKLMKDVELRSVVEREYLKDKRHCYLPICMLSNLNIGEIVRLVFDAAAKRKVISLNDVLLKGPDQLESLALLAREG